MSGDQQAIAIGFTNLIFTMIGMSMIDRLGRKTLLLIGAAGTASCLAGVAWILSQQRAPGHAGVAVDWVYRFLCDVAGRGDLGVYRRGISKRRALKGAGRGECQPLDDEHHHRADLPVGGVAHGQSVPFVFFSVMTVVQFLTVLFTYPETKGRNAGSFAGDGWLRRIEICSSRVTRRRSRNLLHGPNFQAAVALFGGQERRLRREQLRSLRAAPIPRAQRGPKWLATQPTMGAPIGVPPSAMATRRAITLPRIAGSVESCIALLVPLPKVSRAAPMITRAAAKPQYPGAIAARVQPIPKTPAPPKRDGKPGFWRPAANKAPESVPTAMMEEQAESACIGVEDIHGHGGDEDGKVHTKGADQKQHDQDGPEVRPSPHVVKPFHESRSCAMRSGALMQFRRDERRTLKSGQRRRRAR